MSRKPRKESKSQIYHIILRGNNKQLLFYDDADRNLFLNRIEKYSKQLEIKIFSYCLMENHVHIILGNAPKNLLSLFVQKLANSYVYYFNHKYDCSGHLFQGRFKSEPVEDEVYFKNVLRYVLSNPEKAKICKKEKYNWSSYHQLIIEKDNSFIFKDLIFEIFGSLKRLKYFLELPDKNDYMEYENNPYINDEKAVQVVYKLIKKFPQNLKRLPKRELKHNLQILKKQHISVSQLCRITGLPRKVIVEA